ncbi:hypothetical protein HYR69_02845, partial [Candidatus Sumerlaeota bacterium]|nr:hypothetical protein [Candidatus Sumerlaeota bacterium]
MRIYDLAKDLGKRFNIPIKSADLANEIRDNPEFSDIRDTIKSHASSVDEDIVERVIEIYEERIEGAQSKAAEAEEAKKKAEEEKRLEEIRVRRQQFEVQKQREKEAKLAEVEEARRKREEEIRRREVLKSQGKPAAVIPPKPISTGPVLRQAGMSPVPLPGRKMPQQQGSAPPPLSATPPRSEPAAQHPPSPQQPRTGLRPTGTATQLKSSSGTTGYSSGPVEGKTGGEGSVVARAGLRADGQPLP